MSTINPETFESVRKLLEGKEVEFEMQSGKVRLSRYKPDPAYAPMLALFRGPCTNGNHNGPFCRLCGSKDYKVGYVSRLGYWQEAPEGALPGALRIAAKEFDGLRILLQEHNLMGWDLWYKVNPNQVVLEVFEQWLKESEA